MRRERETSRREFVKTACAAAAGIAVAPCAACSSKSPSSGSAADAAEERAPRSGGGGDDAPKGAAPAPERTVGARVVARADVELAAADHAEARDPRARRLVDEALAGLFDVRDPREALRALFDPKDVVAIKLNCLAGPGLSSTPAVVGGLVAGLASIGIPNDQIYIFERLSRELERAGFEPNRYSDRRPRVVGNDEAGYDRELRFSGEVGSLFTNVLARRATALVNVPVLKDHDLSGVGAGMKNLYGVIHNPNRYHDNNCDPYVADVSAHPLVKDKLRLVLLDALVAQYHGGPARVAAHQWRPGMVMAATDPVALDRVAAEIIDRERAAHGMASLAESKRPPRWIATAAERGLGKGDLDLIETEGLDL